MGIIDAAVALLIALLAACDLFGKRVKVDEDDVIEGGKDIE